MEIIDIKDNIVSEQVKASIDEMVNAYCDELIKQDKEIERLNKELEVTTTNEETFRLEMQEITKILGLDQHTIFDDVKDYAKKLVEENKVYSDMNNNNQEVINDLEYKIARLNNIINELEKWLNHSIESINGKLKEDKKETIFKNGICQNLNDYQILRLKTFRTKMNEVLDKLNELKEKYEKVN